MSILLHFYVLLTQKFQEYNALVHEQYNVQSVDIDSSGGVPSEITQGDKGLPGGTEERASTVRYLDENPGQMLSWNPISDNSYYNDYTAGVELNNFFERPVLIQTYSLSESSNFNQTFNPWYNYFSDTRVGKKLDNFSLLSCNLHVKFIINASPFYYGMLIASWRPVVNFANDNIQSGDTYASDLIPLSQRPHIYLYPQTCQGGEMKLPFFYFKNWLRVNDHNEFNNIGQMTLRSIVQLQNANSNASTPITIQVFAWASDVRVTAPTVALSLQSTDQSSVDEIKYRVEMRLREIARLVGLLQHDINAIVEKSKIESLEFSEEEILFLKNLLTDTKDNVETIVSPLVVQSRDEYGTGSISAPASAIARATGLLKRVPIIGPYMTATSMISDTIGQIARIFGFTNVPVISDVQPLKSLVFHSLASCSIGGPIEKLTFDPKNELTIDPRVCGLPPQDDMLISNIVQRESYLGQYTWGAGAAVNSLIFGAAVQPEMTGVYTSGGGVLYRNATPMAHIQKMFKYWRGDIIFRFRFICSKFHRGRALIQWDPEGDIVGQTSTSNVVFTEVVDISKNVDIEVRVPYMQSTPWCLTSTSNNTPYYGGSSYTTARRNAFDNGTLTLKVFTVQTSPVASANIVVVVSVRGADNLEYACPRELSNSNSFFNTQSVDQEFAYENPVSVLASNNINGNSDHLYLVNHGEQITSVRQLMQRSTHVMSLYAASTNTTSAILFVQHKMGRFPPSPGYDPNGIHSAKGLIATTSNFPYNFSQMTPFCWLQYCYVGARGSTVYHINVEANDPVTLVRAVRASGTITAANYVQTQTIATGVTSSNFSKTWLVYESSGYEGQSLTNQKTQAGMSILMPMYNLNRFCQSDPNYNILGLSVANTDTDNIQIDYAIKPHYNTSVNSAEAAYTSFYHSIGPDFSFIFFLNVPSVIINSGLPNPN